MNTLDLKKARRKLGKTGEQMTDSEIVRLYDSLYAFINQILDNNIEPIKLCKKR